MDCNSSIEYRLIDLEKDLTKLSKLYIDSWKSTYDKLIPEEYLNELTYEFAENKWKEFKNTNKTSFIYVAIDKINQAICGMAVGEIEEREKEIEACTCGLLYSIHVSPFYKGKGIGKSLIKLVANHFKINNSINSLLLWAVIGNNNAINFYKYLGATEFKYQVEYYSNKPINEVCLIWKDINKLLESI